EKSGVFYPRASTLGGCTAHNAMIMLRPHDEDWDGIAELTGDASWRASQMSRYWRLVENCQHRRPWRWLSHLGIDPTGHGWNGWLSSECSIPPQVFADEPLLATIVGSAIAATENAARPVASLKRLLELLADPNDARIAGGAISGVCYTPITTCGYKRVGTYE